MKTKNKNALRLGAYSIGVTAIVIAVIIAANLFVGNLPAQIIHPDLTAGDILEISEETEKIASELKTDVTIYHVVTPGKENTYLTEILNRYSSLSSYIKITVLDPTTPSDYSLISQYTDPANLFDNSLIVVSDKRSTVVFGTDLYKYEIAGYEGTYLSYEEYYNYASQMYNYYGQSISATQYFFAENELTRAIDYVKAEDLPILYVLAGHGETELTEAYTEIITDENVTTAELSLLTGESVAVPEDAAAVVINIPQLDISEEEKTALETYVDGGGSILLMTDFQYLSAEKMPNLYALTDHMGLTAIEDAAIEGDSERIAAYPFYIFPTLSTSGLNKNLSSTNIYVLMAYAHPITETGSNENAATVALMTTSSSAYLAADETKVDTYALAYESTLADGGTLIWYGTPCLMDTGYQGNTMILTATLQELCGKSDSVSLVGKPMSTGYLDEVSSSDAILWGIVMVVAIPVATLTAGFVIWFRRRRR